MCEMEMPCLCECGKWFDLNDGRRSSCSGITVCLSCFNIDAEITDLYETIESLEAMKGKKKLIKKIEQKIEDLKFKKLNKNHDR